MRVSVVVVGKARALAPVIREYEARAARYWPLEVDEVPQARGKVAAGVLRRGSGPDSGAAAPRLPQGGPDPVRRPLVVGRAGPVAGGTDAGA